ncbi:MAG: ABC transporter ATP-binding protein [Clostridia bacterium]|nr:ABC transporter ATP-binding protein [Clostridia bacterium]
MANLKLKNVSKIYPSGELALYKCNLEFGDGEFVAVVGGEKCGKSTLLKVVAGVEEVTEGEIEVGGKDVTQVDTKDRDIAMIFQGGSLYQSLNVYDNMSFGLKIRKTSNTVIEQRVKAAAEILGLSDVLFRKPKTLTAEQKQRVAFGRAIVREPKLYLLDDPLSGIAAEARENLRSVLINLQIRMNGTFIYACKNVNEALTMATRVIVLRNGFVQQSDTPANLYDYPANAYVAFTIGSPTVNFVNGAEIVVEDGAAYAVAEGVKFPLPENIVKRFTAIQEYAGTGKKIILGIRPEDTSVGEGGLFKAKVTAAEEICGTLYAECDCGKLSFVVRADKAAKGDEAEVCADMTHALIFDAETRLTLLERDGGYVKTDSPDADFKPLSYGEEETLKKKFSLSDAGKNKKNKK